MKNQSPAEVDFWLNFDKYSNLLDRGNSTAESTIFTVNMIKLASIRKAISNFVRILTRRNIPVYFNDENSNVNFNGRTIYLSANLNKKSDFDAAVGQALHEGAHTLKTDFEMAGCMWANIPPGIFKVSDAKNIRRHSIEKFIHDMWNVIEDRYIDDYVFKNAPGYRGYYVALYDKFWHNVNVDAYLMSDKFRTPSLDSYDFRITNFTNSNTDLSALPRLEEIARVIDIENISRLKSTKDRIKTAFKVTEIVLDCLTPTIDDNGKGEESEGDDATNDEGKSSQQKNKSKVEKMIEFEDEESESNQHDEGTEQIKEISDVLSGKSKTPDKPAEDSEMVSKISETDIDDNEQGEIDKIVESQRKFLNGELEKGNLTPGEKVLLDLIETHGITLVQVEIPPLLSGNDTSLKVDCIVVEKMTDSLVFSGSSVFPLTTVEKIGNDVPNPPKEIAAAVSRGISLGTKLGRKLHIRSEENPIKTVRKKAGKINKRQLHEIASGIEDIFYRVSIEKHNKVSIHISIDASSSMNGEKWNTTMTTLVAICKAASMASNIHVTVSFRTTHVSGNVVLPYVILAYDSNVDKFAKVKRLFPYLHSNGWTPEGLAYGAIMNMFNRITPDEEERYFFNLSDGQPCYTLSVPERNTCIYYNNNLGVEHTKTQVNKIRKYGVDVLSYFISTSEVNPQLESDFKKMYGAAAKFIDVTDVTQLAYTINGLFLQGTTKKSS